MDEAAVRDHATRHGEAVVVRNLRQAAGDVAPEAGAKARQVMGELPDPLSSADVTAIVADGEGFRVTIRYRGEGEETTVESSWAERDGRPVIVDLRTV